MAKNTVPPIVVAMVPCRSTTINEHGRNTVHDIQFVVECEEFPTTNLPLSVYIAISRIVGPTDLVLAWGLSSLNAPRQRIPLGVGQTALPGEPTEVMEMGDHLNGLVATAPGPYVLELLHDEVPIHTVPVWVLQAGKL